MTFFPTNDDDKVRKNCALRLNLKFVSAQIPKGLASSESNGKDHIFRKKSFGTKILNKCESVMGTFANANHVVLVDRLVIALFPCHFNNQISTLRASPKM